MARFTYKGRKAAQVSFPLGGIGTGSIGLGGNGRLLDWEIFNRPNKGSFNGFSHFAIKAEAGGRVLDARVLNGDLPPPYSGQFGLGDFGSFGFGAPRQTMAGMPHFRSAEFDGRFPIACLRFIDPSFPGRVRLTALNPFIPGNEQDSGIPAALFEFEVRNTGAEPVTYTLAGTLANPLPAPNLHIAADDLRSVTLGTTGLPTDDPGFGDLTLATDAADAALQSYWYRGGWNDNLEVYWRDFTAPGLPADRVYAADAAGRDNHATLAARITVPPGKAGKVRFVISWSFANCTNYWNAGCGDACAKAGLPRNWRNWYATVWPTSRESAGYALANWKRLVAETRTFRDALFASTLPEAALDAISANLSILKSPTVMRLEDGAFYGFEGCHPASGCCEGSCTHVWNYAQALPFLFPALERSMREADYRHNLLPSGAMPFRIQLPLGVEPSGFRPCADGQFGGVMKTYRDWKVCGDTEWLRRLWPAVKASIEFAWSPQNADRWDPDKTGVLWGRQHHTLDMELFGPNAWLTGFYLGALRAGAAMAEALGEPGTAADYRALAERGAAWIDANVFNGSYYAQQVDLTDKATLEAFGALEYWSQEHGEIKYQVGDGCGIDQALAQWHSDLYGLGDLLDPDHVQTALASLYKHNFKDPIRNHYNPWRLFCLNDEAGLVMCDWPQGVRQPRIPLTYAQETMHGFEYAAAGLMISRGLVEEGERVVQAVRDRYDGEARNPWNEIECGSNYARSMASYGLLLTYSGFTFDMARGAMGFAPVRWVDGRFRAFWSVEGAWGDVELTPASCRLTVLHGSLTLKRLELPFAPASVALNGAALRAASDAGGITIGRGSTLVCEA